MLFVAEKPVGRSELARIVGATPRAVESALADLAAAYEGTGLRLQRSGDEWQIVTAPQHAAHVAAYLGADRLRVSAASLETLAVIAYKQPVTRAEVEAQTLDRLETEVDITRQILGWAIASAPSSADKKTLQGFDKRLAAFGQAVFTLEHPGTTNSGPSFPPPQKHPFKQNLDSLMGEIPLPQSLIAQAEQGATSKAQLDVLH